MRVAAAGGEPETLVRVKEDEVAHGPQMLPDGRHVLFTVATGTSADRWDKAKVVLQALNSDDRKTLIDGGSDGRVLPTGHIVYALGGTLLAVPFDLRRLEVKGGPVAILEGLRRGNTPEINPGVAHFSVSTNGALIYVPGPVSPTLDDQELVRVNPKGGTEPLKLPRGRYETPRVSPDGKRLAFATEDAREAIVWIYDLSGTSSVRRLTVGGRNRYPIWSADGERVAFQSDREGDASIFWQRADGTGPAERLTTAEPGIFHVPESWSPKGDRFLFSTFTKASLGASLWTFSLQDRKVERFGGVQSSMRNPPRGRLFSRWPLGRVRVGRNRVGWCVRAAVSGDGRQVSDLKGPRLLSAMVAGWEGHRLRRYDEHARATTRCREPDDRTDVRFRKPGRGAERNAAERRGVSSECAHDALTWRLTERSSGRLKPTSARRSPAPCASRWSSTGWKN